MTMDVPRLLLVDDDADLVSMMREYLEPEGFAVDVAMDARSFQSADPQNKDLIILDVMLPGRSGFELLKDLRKTSNVPVIMLTARDGDIDRVVGLEIGADDYISKPFNARELVARIRAVLRRTGSNGAKPGEAAQTETSVLAVGDVELDTAHRTVRCRERTLDLTTAEFNLLEHFLKKAGQVVSRDELSLASFARPLSAKIDRNVDTLVSKLRRKLDPQGDVECRIKTVRNMGYIYTPQNATRP